MIWSGRGAVKGEACEAHDQQGGFVEPLLGVSGLVTMLTTARKQAIGLSTAFPICWSSGSNLEEVVVG